MRMAVYRIFSDWDWRPESNSFIFFPSKKKINKKLKKLYKNKYGMAACRFLSMVVVI